jgi:tRNA 2-thiocytidine biosynthesis protein TtcA
MKYEGKRLTKLERGIVKQAGVLIERFRLIEPGDRIMVCVSGGKDSYALLEILLILQRSAPIAFELVALNLDQGWAGYDQERVMSWLATKPVEAHGVRREHGEIVQEKLDANLVPCSLCSRLRRGSLYDLAVELGCSKVALGHHLDDAADSLLLNLMFNGRLASLPPRLLAKDGRNVVIRPLLAVSEAELIELAMLRGYPMVRCGCPFVCASVGERLRVRQLREEMQRHHPRILTSIRAALANVQTKFLWMDEAEEQERAIRADPGPTPSNESGTSD